MNSFQPSQKVIIGSAVGLFVTILALWIFSWFYGNGNLVLTVNNLKIEPKISVVDSEGKTVAEESGYEFRKRLNTGDYTVTVVSGINTSQKSVTVGRFLSETRESIEVIDSLRTVPVTNIPVYKPNPTPDGMRFIDTVVWKLGEYRNQEMTYYDTNNVLDVAWINDTSGYISAQGQATSSIRLGLLRGRSIQNIDLPERTVLPVSLHYDTNALYLVINKSLYVYREGEFTKRFDVPELSRVVFVTDDSIGVVSYPNESFDNKNATLTIHTLEGSAKKEIDLGTVETTETLFNSAVASEDNSRIAVGVQGVVTIYDASTLDELYTLPNSDVTALSWNDDSLLYATGNLMWRYSDGLKLSQSITELLPYMRISEILFEGDDIYLVNQKATTSSVYKISDDFDETVAILEGTETTFVDPGCYFNYYHQTGRPILFIHQEINDISRCITPLRDYLRTVQIDPADVIIKKSDGAYNPY